MAQTAARSLSYNCMTMDKDIGDMFLNSPLPSQFKHVLGIDLAHYKDELGYLDLTCRKASFSHLATSEFKAR